MPAKQKNEFLMYKGKPLVRCGDTLYYGDPSEDYILQLSVISKKQVANEDVPDMVTVQLMKTDNSIRPSDRIVHKIEKRGLYSAMHIGMVWLERALKN